MGNRGLSPIIPVIYPPQHATPATPGVVVATSVIPATTSGLPLQTRGSASPFVLRGYFQVRLRCGLLLCPWETYDIQLLKRRFPVLKRRTDNSFHGTSTRWIYRRSRRTVCPLLFLLLGEALHDVVVGGLNGGGNGGGE